MTKDITKPFHRKPLLVWGLLTGVGTLLLGLGLTGTGSQREPFLPGKTTHGHFQIELSCESCHTSNFADTQDIQTACLNCHQEELKIANDSHPESKFTDPRNADRVDVLDARLCVTCHSEHRPELTATMGLSLPGDYCYHCHQDIAEDRPSHKGMAFDSCDDAGCHNYHDNSALYEDYLAKHLDEPVHLASQTLPAKRPHKSKASALVREQADGPRKNSPHLASWSSSAHAKAGVNCTGCHQPEEQATWSDEVDFDTCQTCHANETKGWLSGRHGMRRAVGLTPMTVEQARLPMKPSEAHRSLTCSSCHDAHASNTEHAAVEACLTCHNDNHSLAYKSSSHFDLWSKQVADGSSNTGVSCATCHLPRLTHPETEKTYVEHNQNSTLRPNEKMVRTVCTNCHGVGFAIDALADRALIDSNFSTVPSVHVSSLELVKQRLEKTKKPR